MKKGVEGSAHVDPDQDAHALDAMLNGLKEIQDRATGSDADTAPCKGASANQEETSSKEDKDKKRQKKTKAKETKAKETKTKAKETSQAKANCIVLQHPTARTTKIPKTFWNLGCPQS